MLLQSIAISAVVQWLGYLAFTQETRVQTPAAEHLLSGNFAGRMYAKHTR